MALDDRAAALHPDDVADEWAAVARALGTATTRADGPGPVTPARSDWGPTPGWNAEPATAAVAVDEHPPHHPADLRHAMADGGARRDLRRILIAFGAIGKTRENGQPGTPARPEDVVGAFMTATPPVIDALLRGAGAIRDESRLIRFVDGIASVGQRSDPTDPTAVTAWITAVGAILRDDASA